MELSGRDILTILRKTIDSPQEKETPVPDTVESRSSSPAVTDVPVPTDASVPTIPTVEVPVTAQEQDMFLLLSKSLLLLLILPHHLDASLNELAAHQSASMNSIHDL